MTNISQYLLKRLHELGAKHLFGVCGDVVLGFMEQVQKGPVKQINCCNELNAGYAADGYARINGIGIVVTTFTVGPLSAINAIGGAYAEHVPVVIIAGAPERHHANESRMLHHTLGPDYSVARQMFRNITVACEYLDDPAKAPEQIDRALSLCLYYKRPIYLELPADLVVEKCPEPQKFPWTDKKSNASALQESVTETLHLLSSAKNPIILLGMEVLRLHLQEDVKKLLDKTGYGFVSFPTGKTAISEDHPQFIGIYQGDWSRPYVKEMVEKSDLIVMLGAFLIDSDTGGFTANLPIDKLIQVNFEQVKIKNQIFENVKMHEFLNNVIQKIPPAKKSESLIPASQALKDESRYICNPKEKLLVKRFFKRIGSFIKPDDIVIVDVGDSLYSTSGMLFPKNTTYISQAFYNSIGFSVGAALGAATGQTRRALLFVGDGSFQIGAQEIATMIHTNCKITVFVLNNDGYGIERAIYDGPYNDLSPWRYHLLSEAFNGPKGILVETEGQLEDALKKSEENIFTFIEIKVGKFDFGDILKLAGAAMAKSSKKSYE
ncbi:MAG TPA: thiamine pyrophosphate-binding protein [Gammaproteobacteria bacterium]|nr:thiamine pyrophosphate-binding protein [Gammaproteobacteria bacterium]